MSPLAHEALWNSNSAPKISRLFPRYTCCVPTQVGSFLTLPKTLFRILPPVISPTRVLKLYARARIIILHNAIPAQLLPRILAKPFHIYSSYSALCGIENQIETQEGRKREKEKIINQEQQERPDQQETITYGNIFPIEGELAEKPVTPRDAALMQKAEISMLGHIQKGGAAAVMLSAATRNEQAGFAGHNDMSEDAGDPGVSITETDLPGKRVIVESVAGQVVDQFGQRAPFATPLVVGDAGGGGRGGANAITIGEALEATAMTAGSKPVERSDAAAIQAAEVRATGSTNVVPRGVAAAAQSAATLNARATKDEDKTKLAEVLSDATSRLPSDRVVTRRDAEGVASAEMPNDPNLTTYPAGVSASVAAAARLNQSK